MIKIGILFAGLFFFCLSAKAQEVATRISEKKPMVGQPFKIQFEIEVNQTDEVQYIPEKNHIKVLKTNDKNSKKDSAKLELTSNFASATEQIQGKYYWQGNYTVVCFDEGWFILPPKNFKINGKPVQSQAKLMVVELIPADNTGKIRDIEEHFVELPSPWLENWLEITIWLLIFLFLIIVCIVVYKYYQKKRSLTNEEPTTNRLDNKQKSLNELELLMAKKGWENDQLKEHFTDLSNIARRYLSAETGISFMEKTSTESQYILYQKGAKANHLKPLGLLLNVSDMIKFAQSSLGKEGVVEMYTETKKFIENFELV